MNSNKNTPKAIEEAYNDLRENNTYLSTYIACIITPTYCTETETETEIKRVSK